MRPTKLMLAATLLAALGTLGCAEADDDDTPESAPATESASQPAPAPEATEHPDTTAEAVWAHLEAEAYRDNWRLWPGKGELYAGAEPHGMLLTTYANDIAYEALLDGGVESLPPGAILVKENYMPDSTFAAATVMMKVEGYNPAHMDWLFAKYDPAGAPEAFGRADGCQACHQQAESGYVYTPVQR